MQLYPICELLPLIILEKYMHDTLHCNHGEICICSADSAPIFEIFEHWFETISCKLAARCLFTPLMPPFEGEFDANEENVVAKAIGAQKHLHKQRISPRNPFIFVKGTHYICYNF